VTGSARREIFLFPLGTVLFPGGHLPLKIFEQRYLEMTKACLRDNLPFGVCLIREGREVGTPAVPQSVGCLAVIEQWDMPHTGMFHLIARGSDRFRVVETRVAVNGLMSGTVNMLPAVSAAEPDHFCAGVLKQIIDKIGAQHFPQPLKLEDAAWVAYRLAEILPLETAQRQQLLETDSTDAFFVEIKKYFKNNNLQNID
jgi:Lon protease-like protein